MAGQADPRASPAKSASISIGLVAKHSFIPEIMLDILAIFPNISNHIIESKGIGFFEAHFMGISLSPMPGIGFVPAIVSIHFVSPII
jgi:hypothetical protein